MTGSAIFQAIIPSTQTAIRIHGDEGMRLTLDVDESNLAEALKLLMWRGKALKVTVEPVGGVGSESWLGRMPEN